MQYEKNAVTDSLQVSIDDQEEERNNAEGMLINVYGLTVLLADSLALTGAVSVISLIIYIHVTYSMARYCGHRIYSVTANGETQWSSNSVAMRYQG